MKRTLCAVLAAVILTVSLFSLNVFASDATKTEALLAKLNEAKEVSVTLTAGDTSFFGMSVSSTSTFTLKDNNAAYEYNTGLLRVKVILRDGAAYAYLPSVPFFYVKLDNTGLKNLDVWSVIENATKITIGVLNYVSSYEEELNGVTYYVEEFNDRAQVTSKFYYSGDQLKLINVKDARTGSVQNTLFENISFEAADSEFTVPTGLNLSTVLKWLFTMMIATA